MQIKRLIDGQRKIVSISEITGVHEGVISMQEIFTFKPSRESSADAEHRACGIRPLCESKLLEFGYVLPANLLTGGSGDADAQEPYGKQADPRLEARR